MPKKRRKTTDPDDFGKRYIPRQFALDHCYRYPWNKKDREEYLVYLINLYAPTKSGYLVEQPRQMWRKPMVCINPDLAYVCLVAPQDVWELTLRRQSIVPRYYAVMLIPKAEAKRWYGNRSAYKDTATAKVSGEIKYY